MNYLELEKVESDEWPYLSDRRNTSTSMYHYDLLPEGEQVLELWSNTKADVDEIVSGVLADWLDENRESLLIDATGPSDPAERLDRLINWLRNRLLNPVGG